MECFYCDLHDSCQATNGDSYCAGHASDESFVAGFNNRAKRWERDIERAEVEVGFWVDDTEEMKQRMRWGF